MFKIVPVDFSLPDFIGALPPEVDVERALSMFATLPTGVTNKTYLTLDALRVMSRKPYEAISAYDNNILTIAAKTVEDNPRSLIMALELIFSLSVENFTTLAFLAFKSNHTLYDHTALTRLVSDLTDQDITAFVVNASSAISALNMRLIHPASLSSGWEKLGTDAHAHSRANKGRF